MARDSLSTMQQQKVLPADLQNKCCGCLQATLKPAQWRWPTMKKTITEVQTNNDDDDFILWRTRTTRTTTITVRNLWAAFVSGLWRECQMRARVHAGWRIVNHVITAAEWPMPRFVLRQGYSVVFSVVGKNGVLHFCLHRGSQVQRTPWF